MVYLLSSQKATLISFDWTSILNPDESILHSESSTLPKTSTIPIASILLGNENNYNSSVTPKHTVRNSELNTPTGCKVKVLRNSAHWTFREIADHTNIPLATVFHICTVPTTSCKR